MSGDCKHVFGAPEFSSELHELGVRFVCSVRCRQPDCLVGIYATAQVAGRSDLAIPSVLGQQLLMNVVDSVQAWRITGHLPDGKLQEREAYAEEKA